MINYSYEFLNLKKGKNEMKKKLLATALSAIAILSLAGCGNIDLIDTNYTYDKAIIGFPNGEVLEVEVKQWKDYDGEQLQIIAKDGTVYLTNSINCTLINKK